MQAISLLLIGLFAVVGRSNGYFVIPYKSAIGNGGEEADDSKLQHNGRTERGYDEDRLRIGNYYRGDSYDNRKFWRRGPPDNEPDPEMLRMSFDDENNSLRGLTDNYGGNKWLGRSFDEENHSLRSLTDDESSNKRINHRPQIQLYRGSKLRLSNQAKHTPILSNPSLYYNRHLNGGKNVPRVDSHIQRNADGNVVENKRFYLLSLDAALKSGLDLKDIKRITDAAERSFPPNKRGVRYLDLKDGSLNELPVVFSRSPDAEPSQKQRLRCIVSQIVYGG